MYTELNSSSVISITGRPVLGSLLPVGVSWTLDLGWRGSDQRTRWKVY
jgi:hypothetical protein